MHWDAKYTKAMTLPHSWQQLHNGECYCNALSDYFCAWFPKILGNQLLKLGGLSAEIPCDCFLAHQILLSADINEHFYTFAEQKNTSVIQATMTDLPFVENSVNGVVLANVLNFSQDPHQILREVDRVLTEDGYLFLSLFNPFSPLLFKKQLNSHEHEKLRFRHYLPWLVLDWLSLLNFEILDQQKLVHCEKTKCFPHLIAIVARKRVYPLTLNPQKVRFKNQEVFEPVSAFKEQLLRK
ncbi:TPA: class I SAM-dependent methyltransferase [Pasteurella multocida]|nr:class I SAM-dependent methyltransferase [Pasteurella multocida]